MGWKSYILILVVLAISLNGLAINPPGTKRVKLDKEIIYIDRVEITCLDWREYIFSLEQRFGKDSDEVKAALPQGIDGDSFKDILSKEMEDKPITGISLEQAIKYCEWRTAVVNIVNEETGRAKVQYNLPSEEQYSKLIKVFGAYEILSEKNRTERLSGLQSGVYELTGNGSVLKNNGTFSKEETLPSNNVGFRCVATTIKRK